MRLWLIWGGLSSIRGTRGRYEFIRGLVSVVGEGLMDAGHCCICISVGVGVCGT